MHKVDGWMPGERRLVVWTYSEIGQLCGLKGRTVRQYASRGYLNPRDIPSILRFIDKHRAKRGWCELKQEGDDDGSGPPGDGSRTD